MYPQNSGEHSKEFPANQIIPREQSIVHPGVYKKTKKDI